MEVTQLPTQMKARPPVDMSGFDKKSGNPDDVKALLMKLKHLQDGVDFACEHDF